MQVDQLGTALLMIPAGFGIGILYFQVLWMSITTLDARKKWGTRIIRGFIIRMLLVVSAFYLLMGNDWKRLIGLAVGFWLARLVMVRRIGIRNPIKKKSGAP